MANRLTAYAVKTLAIAMLLTAAFQTANAADTTGLNVIPTSGFTRVFCWNTTTCTDGSVESAKSNFKKGFGGVAYSSNAGKLYTVTNASLSSVMVYSADGTSSNVPLLEPSGTTGWQMRTVGLRFNDATDRLYIYGISGSGSYNFASSSGVKTLDSMNNDLFVLILDNTGHLLNVASMLGSDGTNSEIAGTSPQEDSAGSFYIYGKNAGKWVVIKMSGTAAADGSDVEHIATFTGVTVFGGVAPLDTSNFYATGKDASNGKTFVAKFSNVTYSSTGTVATFDASSTPRALDYTNGFVYSVMDFTWATVTMTAGAVTSTVSNPNLSWANSILLSKLATFDTAPTMSASATIGNNAWATSFWTYFKESGRDTMVIGGTYLGTGDLWTGAPITNRGSADAFLSKISFASLTNVGFTVISTVGPDGITAGSNGLSEYYYAMDSVGNIIQYASNAAMTVWVCGPGFTASIRTTMVNPSGSASYVNGTFNAVAASGMPAATASELAGEQFNYSDMGGIQYGVNTFLGNILNYPWINATDGNKIMYNGWRNYGLVGSQTDLTDHKTLNQAGVTLYLKDFKNQSSLNYLMGSILGSNGLSYNQWYTLKWVTNDMFYNNYPATTNVYVDWSDFRSYTKVEVEKNDLVAGAGWLRLGDFYIYARGLGVRLGWTVDSIDTSSNAANKVTYRKIDGKWPMTDAGEKIAVFPIKDKSAGDKVVAFFEYDCGNLVCSSPSCMELKKSTASPSKYICGNGIIDPGEQCDGVRFSNADQQTYGYGAQNASGATVFQMICNADCSLTVKRSTKVSALPGWAYEQRIVSCTPIRIPTPGGGTGFPSTYCGDGTIQPLNSLWQTEECELDNPLCGRLGTGLDGKSDMCRWTTVKCGDGIIEKPNHTGIVEECDNGVANDGVTSSGWTVCSKTCSLVPTDPAIRDIRLFCWNGVVEWTEECDGTTGITVGTNKCTNACKLEAIPVPPCTDAATCTAYCGNNIIDGLEQCDGNDMPIGNTRASGWSCSALCKLNPPPIIGVPLTNACGDGNVSLRADGQGEDCDFGTNPISKWTTGTNGRACGYPTIPDPASFIGGTLVNPKACKYEWCGDGVLDPTEQCDFGSAGNDGLTASGGIACTTMCKIKSLQCGDGIMQSGESCDFGSKNGTSYAENGFSCNNECQFVPGPEGKTCANPSSIVESSKATFLYFRSDHLDQGYKLYSLETGESKWSINDIQLPTSPTELLSYGVTNADATGLRSDKNEDDLTFGRKKINEFVAQAKATKAFTRKQTIFDTIAGGKAQRITDRTNNVDSLSFNLNDILTGGYGVRRTGFDWIVALMRGTQIEVIMKDCSGNYTAQGKVTVIGVIDGDNNSINLVKSYGQLLPTNPYDSTGLMDFGW